MQRYTREALLRASGARPDELADFEARRLLLPNRPAGPSGRGEPYYTASQLAVLRYLLRSCRLWETARQACPAPGEPGGARHPHANQKGGQP